MPDISEVAAKALLFCKPTEKEARRISAVANEAKSLVEHQVDSSVTGVVFGGSFAKGTWLRGDADIDIFFKVKPSVGIDEFEKMGRDIGQKALKKYNPKL